MVYTVLAGKRGVEELRQKVVSKTVTTGSTVLKCGPAASSSSSTSRRPPEDPMDTIRQMEQEIRRLKQGRSGGGSSSRDHDDSRGYGSRVAYSDSRSRGYNPNDGYLDDDEDDYDDMDGFIDDAAEDAADVSDPDVSKCIREVFGYDKRKYRNISDDDSEVDVADFHTIQREEARSARIAAKEDAEELRRDLERQKMKKLKLANR